MRVWYLGLTDGQGFKNYPCMMPQYETVDNSFDDPDDGFQDKGACGPTDDPWIMMVRDGKSDYVIVIAGRRSPSVQT